MEQLLEKENFGKDFAQTGLEPEVVGVRLWHIVRVVDQVFVRVGITALVQFQTCTENWGGGICTLYCVI